MKKNILLLLLALIACSLLMSCNNKKEKHITRRIEEPVEQTKETYKYKEQNDLFAVRKLKPIPVTEAIISDLYTGLIDIYENEKYMEVIPDIDKSVLETNLGIYNDQTKKIDVFHKKTGNYHMSTKGKVEMFDSYIVWGEMDYNDTSRNPLTLELVCVDKSGQKETLMTHEVEQHVTISKCSDSILYITTERLEDEETLRDTLQTYNIKEKTHTIIKENESKISSDGKISGTILVATGGTSEENIYYATVELNNEYVEPDETGITKVYRYNMKTNTVKEMGEFPRKITYLSGGKDYFIISDFAYEEPLQDTGHLYLIDEENKIITSCLIPDARTGEDVNYVAPFSDTLIYMRSYMYSYLYDLKTKEIVKMGVFGLRKYYSKQYENVERAHVNKMGDKVVITLITDDKNIDLLVDPEELFSNE